MHEVIEMPKEPDYKAAYEILDKAVQEASRILRQAHVHTLLKMQIETGQLTAEDEQDLDEEIAAFNQRRAQEESNGAVEE